MEENGEKTWYRWPSSIGGLRLGADQGSWKWDVEDLWLDTSGAADDEAFPYAIVLFNVPYDFFNQVICSDAIQGLSQDSKLVDYRYELWDVCV
jgi:hypothetical protein